MLYIVIYSYTHSFKYTLEKNPTECCDLNLNIHVDRVFLNTYRGR